MKIRNSLLMSDRTNHGRSSLTRFSKHTLLLAQKQWPGGNNKSLNHCCHQSVVSPGLGGGSNDGSVQVRGLAPSQIHSQVTEKPRRLWPTTQSGKGVWTTKVAYLGSTAFSSHLLVSPPQAVQETCFCNAEAKARKPAKRPVSPVISRDMCRCPQSSVVAPHDTGAARSDGLESGAEVATSKAASA